MSRTSSPIRCTSRNSNSCSGCDCLPSRRCNRGGAALPSSLGATYSTNSSTNCLRDEGSAKRRAALQQHFVDLQRGQPSHHGVQVQTARGARHPFDCSGPATPRAAPPRRQTPARRRHRIPWRRAGRSTWYRAPRAAAGAPRDRRSSRTLSRGSSARTVPAPVNTAELRARQICTSARDASPLIHCLTPAACAVRASRLIASFSRTNGRPRSKREK